ncbi:hypothetical protein Scani_20580 [Streptomyces caniferus]|uniref:Uncharacterized protein n=1 Tax=Streptomyces caniferus TaxID=285557 RepID=A0A640S3R6_9ACTN|nr:hypothetical protein Scani_20580 [Streptomyces caniferus]
MGFEARHPAARDHERLRRGAEKVDRLVEPAVLQPEGLIELCAGQVQVPGYARSGEPQTRDRARLCGVRAQQERGDHGGLNGTFTTPQPTPGNTVVLWHPRAQVNGAPFGERIPHLTFRRRQLVV